MPRQTLWPYEREPWSIAFLSTNGIARVVFGRHEQEALRRADPLLHVEHGRRLLRVVVLVVERQLADRHVLEREVRRRELHDRVRQLAIVGVAPKAADDDGDRSAGRVGLLCR